MEVNFCSLLVLFELTMGDEASKYSLRLSVEGTSLIEGEEAAEEELPPEKIVLDVNKCGCTNYFTKILIGVFLALALLFVGVSNLAGPQGGAALFLIGIICLITSIVNCNILWCACCQQPKGADE